MFHFHYITCTICCAALHSCAPLRIKGLVCEIVLIITSATRFYGTEQELIFRMKSRPLKKLFPFAFFRYDYVEVRDGVDESGQLVGKYCGKIAPSPVVSSGNQLFIKFVSDYETHGAGFSIRYEIFKTGGWPPNKPQMLLILITLSFVNIQNHFLKWHCLPPHNPGNLCSQHSLYAIL